MDKLEKLRKERGYSYKDVIEICPEKLSDYENKVNSFTMTKLTCLNLSLAVVSNSGQIFYKNNFG